MGILRTLFAISVIFAHSVGFVFVGGRNAVQLFYMISGFLISYVIVEKKVYSKISDFYINRYLRLYPIYFVVALLSLLAITFELIIWKEPTVFKVYHNAPFSADLFLIISNATIFLQDLVMFAGIQKHHLVFSTCFWKSDVVLSAGLLVPQAWTLGVELTFYLIAPFVLKNKKMILFLLIISIVIRLYLIRIGLGTKDPWTYRFFPSELSLFLLGSLAHQILLPRYRKMLSVEYYSKISTYILISITLFYWLIPMTTLTKTIILFSVFFFCMPFSFLFQIKRNWDKWIGNLSYPMYICHIFILQVIFHIFIKTGATNNQIYLDRWIIGCITILLSFCFSIILNKAVSNPIESLRNHFRMGDHFYVKTLSAKQPKKSGSP